MKKHYSEVEKALYAAWYIREGKCYESIAAYWHKENDLKDAPPLEKVVMAIEKHLDLFTEGEYQKCVAAHEKQDWKLMEENRVAVNKHLPNYSQISSVELVAQEFEKTPKRSIKRFLYQ